MSKQDRGGVRTAQDLERKYDFSSLINIKKNVELQQEALTKTNASLNNFIDNVTGELSDIHNQLDGNITTYFYSGIPTLENIPASEWTDTEYANHLGDLYYDNDTGKAYRFVFQDNVYTWLEIVDSDVAEALAIANAAKDTADGKRRVFVSQPEPPYDNGDLYVSDGDLFICQISKEEGETYEEVDFVLATNYTDDTYAKQVGDNLTVLEGTVLEIQKGVNEYKIEFETTVKTIQNETKENTEALETMSYSFGTKDLAIANSSDPVNARINNQGLKVYSYNELKQITNHKGVGAQDLIVVGYSQLGNLRITKAKDENGEDCTDFHHLISNIQSLSDLE